MFFAAQAEGLAYVGGKKNEVVLTAPTATLMDSLQMNLAEEMKKDTDLEFVPLK